MEIYTLMIGLSDLIEHIVKVQRFPPNHSHQKHASLNAKPLLFETNRLNFLPKTPNQRGVGGSLFLILVSIKDLRHSFRWSNTNTELSHARPLRRCCLVFSVSKSGQAGDLRFASRLQRRERGPARVLSKVSRCLALSGRRTGRTRRTLV